MNKEFLRVLFHTDQIVVAALSAFVGIFLGACTLTVVGIEQTPSVFNAIIIMMTAVFGSIVMGVSARLLYLYAHSEIDSEHELG